MNDFTGRRPGDRAKSLGKSLLEGLSYLGTALADSPKRERIEEIDKTIADLQQERDHLIKDLIEPGDLKVSENYDPRWRKDEEYTPTPDLTFTSDAGRLTKCGGQWSESDTFSVHPGCPYKGGKHNRHEFTLRD